MKKILGLFACIAFLQSAVIAQGNRFTTDSLDSYIEKGMKDWQIPGLAIAIVKDGKVV